MCSSVKNVWKQFHVCFNWLSLSLVIINVQITQIFLKQQPNEKPFI